MAYVITENIFNLGPEQKAEFASSTCQVLILFDELSEIRSSIAEDLGKALGPLHNNTTDAFAIFLVTEPPGSYTTWQHTRLAFKARQLREETTEHQRRNLNLDFARCVGISLEELPAVIISPAMWGEGFYTVVPSLRDASEISQVVSRAEEVSRILPLEWNQRRRHNFIQKSFSVHSDLIDLQPDLTLDRRKRMANVASLSNESVSFNMSKAPFKRDLQRLERKSPEQLSAFADDLSLDYLLATSRVSRLNPNRSALDSTSAQIYGTAQQAFEMMRDWRDADFSPCASGFWKTVEREFNLSAFQILRSANGVKIPEKYGLYDEQCSDLPVEVPEISNPRLRLNRRLKSDKGSTSARAELPSLGNVRYIFRWGCREGIFDIPPSEEEGVFNRLSELTKIRNQGSHLESLNREKATTARQLSESILDVFLDFKTQHGFPPSLTAEASSREFCYPQLTIEAEERAPQSPQEDSRRRSAKTRIGQETSDLSLVIHALAREMGLDPCNMESRDYRVLMRRLGQLSIDIQRLLLAAPVAAPKELTALLGRKFEKSPGNFDFEADS